MLVNQGYMKINARFLENFGEKWREKVCAILVIGSRSGANDVLIVNSVRIRVIYVLLSMFANHD
jgi:hypothetical protein